ncbi:MAG: MoaD/ThiS family protein [Bdellovibrionales bacterium]|nr:MoaD/ThiS family protein [Bdellovibrionales bacterium]
MIALQLQLFGAFRDYAPFVRIEVPAGCRVRELRPVLAEALRRMDSRGNDALVHDSAIASENEVLPEDYRIAASCTLAVLPPVCGG